MMPVVGVTAIGAGGGSVAWVDDVGVPKVGPRSTGARPGPACYGRGGTEATLTDAFLVSRLPRSRAVPRRPHAARSRARRRRPWPAFAGPLGMTPHEGGGERGADRRREHVRGVHQDPVARRGGPAGLRPRRLRRRRAGAGRAARPRGGHRHRVRAALAGHALRARRDQRRHRERRGADGAEAGGAAARTATARSTPRRFAAQYDELRGELADWLARHGAGAGPPAFRHAADMRYVGQSYEIEVPVDPAWLESRAATRALTAAFHQVHERVFGHADREAPRRDREPPRAAPRRARARAAARDAGGRRPARAARHAPDLARRPADRGARVRPRCARPRRAPGRAGHRRAAGHDGARARGPRGRGGPLRQPAHPEESADATGRRRPSRSCGTASQGAVEEMAYVVERTAYTTFVKETADFTCGLLNPAGEFFAYPVELGVASFGGINYAHTLEAVGPARARRRGHHQRPLRLGGGGHAPARHPPGPPDLLGRAAGRLRRGLPAQLRRGRHGAGEHLAARVGDLPGGAADPAQEALRARRGEPRPPRRDPGELPHPRAELGRPAGAGGRAHHRRAADARADPPLRARHRRQGDGRPDRLRRAQGRGAHPPHAAPAATSSRTTSRTTSSPTSRSASRWR